MSLKLVLSLFACILFLAPPALAQDTKKARFAAAERYATVSNFDAMWKGVIPEFAKAFPEQQRAEFLRFMDQVLDPAQMHALAVNSMADTFTLAELVALSDFYSTPTGKSIMVKMPQYMRTIMPALQQEILSRAKNFKPHQ